jgi:NitT/TauT family transport system substrate-binding protein
MREFQAGNADAFLGFPPQPQKLREKGIGHVIVNGTQDRPWSQYTCCVVAATRQYATQYPVATKRVVRALLKAADLCAADPGRAALILARRGFEPRSDIVAGALKELPYGNWREANAEDALRFYALRLHEAGLIKTSPGKLVAQGVDGRAFEQIKQELKL